MLLNLEPLNFLTRINFTCTLKCLGNYHILRNTKNECCFCCPQKSSMKCVPSVKLCQGDWLFRTLKNLWRITRVCWVEFTRQAKESIPVTTIHRTCGTAAVRWVRRTPKSVRVFFISNFFWKRKAVGKHVQRNRDLQGMVTDLLPWLQ